MPLAFAFDGQQRSCGLRVSRDWWVHAPIPMLLFLHGERNARAPGDPPEQWLGGNGPDYLRAVDEAAGVDADASLGEFVERMKLVMLTPQASALMDTGSLPDGTWHSGHYGFDGQMKQADDVGFIVHSAQHTILRLQRFLQHQLERTGVLAPSPLPTTWVDLRRRYALLDSAAYPRAVDLDRVFVFGFGSGAHMVYRLIADLAPGGIQIAAAAVVGGSIGGWRHFADDGRLPMDRPQYWVNLPAPHGRGQPVRLLAIHGELDDKVVYEDIGPLARGSEEEAELIELGGVEDEDAPEIATYHHTFASSVNEWLTTVDGGPEPTPGFPYVPTASLEATFGVDARVDDWQGIPPTTTLVRHNTVPDLWQMTVHGAGHEWPPTLTWNPLPFVWQFFLDPDSLP